MNDYKYFVVVVVVDDVVVVVIIIDSLPEIHFESLRINCFARLFRYHIKADKSCKKDKVLKIKDHQLEILV